MSQKLTETGDGETADVTALLEQRATLQGWLARLEAQRGAVSERVAARVREDYQRRLDTTLAALMRHREAVQHELSQATGRLVEAEERHAEAIEQLEEARLRSEIGELAPDRWREREAALEADAADAEAAQDAAREEAMRLRNLIAQMDELDGEEIDLSEGAAPSGEITRPIPAAAGTADPHAEHAPFVPEPEASSAPPRAGAEPASPAPVSPHSSGDEAESFLAEIDRSLSSVGEETASDGAAATGTEEESVDTAPKRGLKCTECGYTNDLSAWFCGVCGADVG